MSHIANRLVLIVDDDQLICWALHKELSALNLSVWSSETARDALAEIKDRTYDLIFLDVNLPDANGIELLDQILAISPGTKIIVLSADSDPGNRRRALERGAVQFIEKPFDIHEIHRVARSLIGDYTPRREHPRYFCRIPVRISIPVENDIGPDTMSGITADVGPGGLRFHTEYPLRVGQNVRAHLDDANDPFTKFLPPDGVAEVIWVAPDDRSVTAGLRFLS